MLEMKLLKKGIKVNGKYYPCWYSSSQNNSKGNATIYIKGQLDFEIGRASCRERV